MNLLSSVKSDQYTVYGIKTVLTSGTPGKGRCVRHDQRFGIIQDGLDVREGGRTWEVPRPRARSVFRSKTSFLEIKCVTELKGHLTLFLVSKTKFSSSFNDFLFFA